MREEGFAPVRQSRAGVAASALLTPVAMLASVTLLACADASRAPRATPASTTAAVSADALWIVKAAAAADPGGVVVTTSSAVDPTSAAGAAHGFVDVDADAGGVFEPLAGRVEVDEDGRRLRFVPDVAPAPGREVRVVFTRALRDSLGRPLAGGAGTAALSFEQDVQDGVFEVRRPGLAARAAAAAGAGDDHADGAAGATPLTAGAAARGRIDAAGDRDWFTLTLAAGEQVTLVTSTAGDTVLALVAPDGSARVATNDDDPQGGLGSRIVHAVTAGGVHFVEVTGYGDSTPGYALEATVTGTPTAPAPGPTTTDDHGDAAATATPLAFGAGVAGRIERGGDRDWFALSLARGEVVELVTTTSGDTVLEAYAPDGVTSLGSNDDDPQGGGRQSRLRLAAAEAGVHLVVVSGYGSTTPDYQVEARPAVADAGPDPDRFRLRAGTDPWLIDFALRRDAWERDLASHGLRSGDAATDALMEARVVERVLAETGRKYLLDEAGGAVAGASFRVSFTRNRPAGTPGRSYSREAVGGRHVDETTTLGVSYLDPGNRRKEDNATTGELGIFSQVIFGRDSTLSPPLSAPDRRYLDGSYRLGDGSAADDRRFTRVRAVAADWGHALAVVTAHEVGHSVGLDHDAQDASSIMHATLSRWVLSDPGTRFSDASAGVLERSLGREP